jgi:hypothetical protein
LGFQWYQNVFCVLTFAFDKYKGCNQRLDLEMGF